MAGGSPDCPGIQARQPAAGCLCDISDHLPGALGPVDLPTLLKCSLALRELFLLTRLLSHKDLSSAPGLQVPRTLPLSLLQVPTAPKSNGMSRWCFFFSQSTSPCLGPASSQPGLAQLVSTSTSRLCCFPCPECPSLYSGSLRRLQSQRLQAALPNALRPGNLLPLRSASL